MFDMYHLGGLDDSERIRRILDIQNFVTDGEMYISFFAKTYVFNKKTKKYMRFEEICYKMDSLVKTNFGSERRRGYYFGYRIKGSKRSLEEKKATNDICEKMWKIEHQLYPTLEKTNCITRLFFWISDFFPTFDGFYYRTTQDYACYIPKYKLDEK